MLQADLITFAIHEHTYVTGFIRQVYFFDQNSTP